ncbi:CarD family transcriptional regulator [Thermodesulforhabdus norvegica]|uniref:Transcriptional regulator, CarD family n=1 Tax=Thermodesulforhabdus norvegica TaxID=39841 RepID=A0A1I4W669_9BACT|nr:CarD family transcriptional regulator [Thermodesulforhabdus norvegica]SFN08887.1 transcriptional regulator, CarD family [Thermodesulforhabdus norvegica]
MFKEGDLVFYPAHGIGKIEAIQGKSIDGSRQDFYVLRILETDTRIMVPVQNAENVGVRGLVDPGVIPRVFEILKKKEVSVSASTWNKRYREYMEKVKSGSILDLAEVFRDLNLLKEDKTLSFGERKMLETAKAFLVKEISIVVNEPEEEIERRLYECFNNE